MVEGSRICNSCFNFVVCESFQHFEFGMDVLSSTEVTPIKNPLKCASLSFQQFNDKKNEVKCYVRHDLCLLRHGINVICTKR